MVIKIYSPGEKKNKREERRNLAKMFRVSKSCGTKEVVPLGHV